MSKAGRGTLVLVVGPSGAGKDSIIAAAAERLGGETRLVFAQRVVTRPQAAGGENHIAVSPSEFARWRDAGRLMLHWHAHGLDYGLPQALSETLAEGGSVVANVSRTVVDEARTRFAPVVVVEVTASAATLAARLAGRGRETAGDIESRLARAESVATLHADIVIDNDGPLDRAVERFVAILRATLGQPAN